MTLSPVKREFESWLDAALSFFYPEWCQICGSERAKPKEGFVCGRCRARPGGLRCIVPPICDRCGLPFEGAIDTPMVCANCRDLELHFSRARAAVVATDLVLDVIHRYKYGRALWFEPFLVQLLMNEAVPHIAQAPWDWIVPVPLHPVKRREREFNQAERLAKPLSDATGVPLNTNLIRHIKPTQTQTMLNRTQRAANVRKAFAMRSRIQLSGQRIILVDDVLTTGATTSACAQVLKAAGAGEIIVWTVARGA